MTQARDEGDEESRVLVFLIGLLGVIFLRRMLDLPYWWSIPMAVAWALVAPMTLKCKL